MKKYICLKHINRTVVVSVFSGLQDETQRKYIFIQVVLSLHLVLDCFYLVLLAVSLLLYYSTIPGPSYFHIPFDHQCS